MSDYTQKNFFKDVDNSAESQGIGDKLQARFGRKHLDSDELGVSYFKYTPDFKTPFGHSHTTQEEAYVVVSGGGRMKIGDEMLELSQWDVIRVAPSAKRAFAAGSDGLEIIAIGGQKVDDAPSMEQDFWGD